MVPKSPSSRPKTITSVTEDSFGCVCLSLPSSIQHTCECVSVGFTALHICEVDSAFGLFQRLVRFPRCQDATRGDCGSVLEKLDLGAFLLVRVCAVFSCQFWPVSVLSPAQAGGSLCWELSLSRSWKLEGKGLCFWTKKAALLMLTPGWVTGGKGSPKTPTDPPGFFILEFYKCLRGVFSVRLLDSQGQLARK